MPSLGKTVKAETCSIKSHVRGAERERKIRRQASGDAETRGHIHDGIDADFFSQLHRGNVARTGERAAQRDGAFKFLVVIVRRVRLAAADDREWCIDDGVEGRRAFLDGVGINVHLERTADLAIGLRGAIELGIFETVAANHGFDFAGGVVDGDHRGLRRGLLLELNARGGFAKFLNGELRQIADG